MGDELHCPCGRIDHGFFAVTCIGNISQEDCIISPVTTRSTPLALSSITKKHFMTGSSSREYKVESDHQDVYRGYNGCYYIGKEAGAESQDYDKEQD